MAAVSQEEAIRRLYKEVSNLNGMVTLLSKKYGHDLREQGQLIEELSEKIEGLRGEIAKLEKEVVSTGKAAMIEDLPELPLLELPELKEENPAEEPAA